MRPTADSRPLWDGNESRRSLDRIGTSVLLFVIVTTVLLHRVVVSPPPQAAPIEARSLQPVAAASGPDRHEGLSMPPTRVDPTHTNLPGPSTPVDQAQAIRRGGDNQHVALPEPVPLTPIELAKYRPNELGHIPVLMYHGFTTNPAYLDAWTRTPDGFREDLQWLAVHFAREYSPRIRVNAVAPGFFLTDQNRYLLTCRETRAMTPRGQAILDHTPVGRLGEPDDLSGTLLWLVSPASAFVTGAVIPVDGGFAANSGV